MVKQAVISANCEGVMSECVREECVDVAKATLENAKIERQIQEDAHMREEVIKVVSMETGIDVVFGQVFQVATQVVK